MSRGGIGKRPGGSSRLRYAGPVLLALCGGCGGQGDAIGLDPAAHNVVLFLVDDLGWRDAGVLGSPFYDTPAIDALAAAGVRFTRFYAASPVCSPTRASIMTGRHPVRLGITNWIGGRQHGMLLQADYSRHLSLDETTLGDAFAAAGYATGYIGKWHLGEDDAFQPSRRGFSWTRAVNRAGQPGSYFPPYRNPDWPVTDVPDLEDDPPDAYLTDRLTDQALDFMREHQDVNFLLVLSHYAVHTPIQAPDAAVEPYRRRAAQIQADDRPSFESESGRATTRIGQAHPEYAAMIASVDASLARIESALDSLGLRERTAVVFVSDNGGLSTLAGDRGHSAPTANRPLRAGKGWLYEGGIRVPLIVRWAGTAASGSVSDLPATTTDLYPTLLTLAGIPVHEGAHLDGIDLTPFMTGENATAPERDLFWHFPHYHGSGNRPSAALISGDHKLVEWFETGQTELYDLSVDPGEKLDLSDSLPELAEALHVRLIAWRDSTGAAMPTPNPDWEP